MVVKKNHQQWYLQMWSPFVGVGLLKASDLIGYRNNQVYIRGSLHTPLSPDNVRVAMPVLFDLLKSGPNAVVGAVLGHFFFGYIHPEQNIWQPWSLQVSRVTSCRLQGLSYR